MSGLPYPKGLLYPIYIVISDNPGLIGSDSESYGGKVISGPPNRTSDSSIQSGSATPDIHPFFKVGVGVKEGWM